MKTLTIIPSRLSATRLPGKPLFKINDLSIISHVFRRAQEANIGDVVVAAEDQAIVDDVVINADISEVGYKRSFGVMINYLYEFKNIEKNHENYMNNKVVTCSDKLGKYLK